MYKGKKISVAMITYNGEKFIEEQVRSFLTQTVLPDEIVISDDNSGDGTLSVIERLVSQNRHLNIQFVILTDNPNHGIAGNCTWAFTHCTGDYILLSGQDDIWEKDKIEKVAEVFYAHPDAGMVLHNLMTINANGEEIDYNFLNPQKLFPSVPNGAILHIPSEQYIEKSISFCFLSGPIISLHKDILPHCLPIPGNYAEDQWLPFVALADNRCYLLNEKLIRYRIHSSTSHSKGIPVYKIIPKIYSFFTNRYKSFRFACAILAAQNEYLHAHQDEIDEKVLSAGLTTVASVQEVYSAQYNAFVSGRLTGVGKILRFYFSNMRYRKCGIKTLIFDVGFILLYSKKTRQKLLEEQ